MRLALVSVLHKPITREAKGGTEMWTYHFLREHAKRGHSIDLYAVAGSETVSGVTLVPLLKKSLADICADPYFTGIPGEFERRKTLFASTAYARARSMIDVRKDDYDLIIDSASDPSFSFSTHTLEKPVIVVGHLPVDFTLQFYAKIFGWPRRSTVVFPSAYQSMRATHVPRTHKTTIAHGIDFRDFIFNDSGEEIMVWMSRIDARTDKGSAEVMDIANKLQRTIRVTGIIESTPSDKKYVEEVLQPRLSPQVLFEEQTPLVSVDKNAILGRAKLFLFPIKWDEPFGIVMIEAMACGTPIVAYARGSVPEVVEDGVTGFVVNPSDDNIRGNFIVKRTGFAGLCEAVERVYALSEDAYKRMRRACRERVEREYALERMVDRYERLYEEL